MNIDVIASIISFVPLNKLISVLTASSKLPDISLSQYPFGIHSKSELIPTIYAVFGQKAFKLLKNPNISQHHLFINAVHNGMTELVKVMLKNKQIDISKQYCFDSSYEHLPLQNFRPLSHALSENKAEIVFLLLKDNRVNPNEIELYWHPSIHAINKGHIESLKVLIEDTRVNFTSKGIWGEKNQDLVMIMAIRSRHYSVIKLLVRDYRIKLNKKISDSVIHMMFWIGSIYSRVENDFKIFHYLSNNRDSILHTQIE